jgi:hypothetical protein
MSEWPSASLLPILKFFSTQIGYWIASAYDCCLLKPILELKILKISFVDEMLLQNVIKDLQILRCVWYLFLAFELSTFGFLSTITSGTKMFMVVSFFFLGPLYMKILSLLNNF